MHLLLILRTASETPARFRGLLAEAMAESASAREIHVLK